METYIGTLLAAAMLFGGCYTATGQLMYLAAAILLLAWAITWGYKLSRAGDPGHK